MRGIYIIVEGATEEEFVKNMLIPFFLDNGISDVRPILMNTSPGHQGGEISFDRFRFNIENLLRREGDIIVTSLIDFFRLRTDFPGYDNSLAINNKIKRVAFLEEQIESVIKNPFFVPYIQLHEFEGLLFSDINGFRNIPEISVKGRTALKDAINLYDNPELLNDGPMTAPSKRLETIIPGYRKVFWGNFIALDTTLPVIMQRCERFRKWLEFLVEKYSNPYKTNI